MGGFSDEGEEITSINVTPMVDVTLVLLIIFMVTTSVITNQEGLGVEKPEAASGNIIEGDSIMLVCKKDGSTMVGSVEVDNDKAILDAIAEKLVDNRDMPGVVICDEQAEVGTLVHLIDLMRDAGVKKYAIGTRKPKPANGG